MTDQDTPLDPLDSALRGHLFGAQEPEDDGFSLRVMAALPRQRAARRRSRAWLVTCAQWLATSLAAIGAATLLVSSSPTSLNTPEGLAAMALTGLVIFWSIPSRWSRG